MYIVQADALSRAAQASIEHTDWCSTTCVAIYMSGNWHVGIYGGEKCASWHQCTRYGVLQFRTAHHHVRALWYQA